MVDRSLETRDRLVRAARDLAAWPYAADAVAWMAWLVAATVIIVAFFS